MKFRSLTLLAFALTIAAPVADAQPLKIRMDWQVLPGHFAPLIPSVPNYAPNVFRHYGKSYVVEPLRLAGGGATLTALAAGQLEMSGTFSPQQIFLAATEAKIDFKLIAQALTTELPGYRQTRFWVRKNEVKSIQDLRGKVLAVTARGANFDAVIRIMMGRAGLQEPKDFQIAEIRLPAMIPALETKKIDLAPLVPPFDTMASRNPEFAPIFGVGDVFGPVETLNFAVRSDFAAKNRAVLIDFLEDNLRMRRWMFNPATRMDAIRQVSEVSKIPVAELAEWVYSQDDYYFHPKGTLNPERLQSNINTMKEGGIIPSTIDIRPYIDSSLIEEAASRIKD